MLSFPLTPGASRRECLLPFSPSALASRPCSISLALCHTALTQPEPVTLGLFCYDPPLRMVLCCKNWLSLVSVKAWSWAAKGLRRNKKSPAKHPAKTSMYSREPLMSMARFGPVCCMYYCARRTCFYKNSEKPS